MTKSRKTSSVAIIGAGPSGLISAHHFLTPPSPFHVTIFEKTNRTCGLWPTAKDDNERMIDPLMRANKSRYTVQFGATGQRLYEINNEQDEEVDVIPQTWQVGRYLSRLCDEVTSAGVKLELNTEVVSVEKVKDGKKKGRVMKWRVRTRKTTLTRPDTKEAERDGNGDEVKEEEHIFDHLIIASGFFGTPKIPPQLREYLSTIQATPAIPDSTAAPTKSTMQSPLGIPVIHSSKFRSLTQLLSSIPPTYTSISVKRSILVVGGSMSGTEIASALASSLSSLAHSPGSHGASPLPSPQAYEIVHLATRPFYTLPRYLPLDATSSAPTFLPCDLIFHNLVPCFEDRGTNYGGELSDQDAQRAHARFSALSGQEKPHAWIEGDKDTDAPWLAICDDYTAHSRSGDIKTLRGRLAGLQKGGSKDESVSAVIATPGGDEVIDDVAAVVLATGFSSTNSLSFLSEELREELDFLPDTYQPLNLHWQSTICKSFPTLGFVGMYNGPFWGVIEQQSLILKEIWSRWLLPQKIRAAMEADHYLAYRLPYAAKVTPHYVRHPEEYVMDSENYIGSAEWHLLRGKLSQFPMGDFVHTMFALFCLRGLEVDGGPGDAVCWPLVPDSVEASGLLESEEESEEEMKRLQTSPARQAVQRTVDEGMAGRFYPRTLFRALLGRWTLQRTITSKHPSYPSGTLSGTATFYPRTPTSGEYSGEYLYDEEGEFRTDSGLVMRANRRYVWRLKSGKEGEVDRLSQWFVKVSGADKSIGVDYLFHELDIVRPDARPLSSSSGTGDGIACSMTKVSETPGLHSASAADDGEVRGGWASKTSLEADDGKEEVEDGAKAEKLEKVEEAEERLWRAKGHHLCIDDTYSPEYVFRWKGAELESWTMAYTVKGPGKDYLIESRFTR